MNIPNIADQINDEQNEDQNNEHPAEAVDISEEGASNLEVELVGNASSVQPPVLMLSLQEKVKQDVQERPSCSRAPEVQLSLKSSNATDSPNVNVTPKEELEQLPSCSVQITPQQPSHNKMAVASTPSPVVANTLKMTLGSEVVEKRAIKERKVFVHSVILAAKSEFFKCLFATSGMRETKEKEIKIEIGKGETDSMLILLHCFYNRNFITSHPLQTVLNVCNLAMKYCFDGLIEKCLDIFRCRAENIIDVDDINQIAFMVSKIESELVQHKEKCINVMKTCGPFLVNSFYPMDEFLEKSPEKFYQLHLNSMYLFLDASVQERFNKEHGNLFVYSMQKWLKAHYTFISTNEKFKQKAIHFIEKLLSITELKYITGDFLTNVMTYEHSPFSIWPGYKDWYIKALQTFVYEFNTNKTQEGHHDTHFQPIKRRRISKFVRQERNADIFSLTHPIILNGFEIGIYFRIREDNKVHIICKCKNILVNKAGFDRCSLLFRLKGNIKLNVEQNLWCEQFPAAHNHWINDWFSFSYKQNTMCLQMYGICKLAPMVYELAKKYGFFMNIQLQQIK